VLATYLSLHLGKNANLKKINDAQRNPPRAKNTVGLQLTLVADLQAPIRRNLPQQNCATAPEAARQKVENLSTPRTRCLSAASLNVDALIPSALREWMRNSSKQQAAIAE
jgi:hypothetical protein